jgi:hypothetical protein
VCLSLSFVYTASLIFVVGLTKAYPSSGVNSRGKLKTLNDFFIKEACTIKLFTAVAVAVSY